MKTKILLTLSYFFLMFISTETDAQVRTDSTKVREIGIGLRGINDFSIQYFWGSNKRLYRISGDIGGGYSKTNSNYNTISLTDSIPLILPQNNSYDQTSLDFGLNFSMFKKRFVSDKFGFLFGQVISFNYRRNVSTSNSSRVAPIFGATETTNRTLTKHDNSYRPALGLLLGAFYNFTPKVYLYVEIRPQIYYSFANSLEKNISTKKFQ
ncbi:MAG: hypothetical protein IPO92_21965 [Saprospiraceae bacterium]|nr:hypothetical protein [Saprospiraceae bacterium]